MEILDLSAGSESEDETSNEYWVTETSGTSETAEALTGTRAVLRLEDVTNTGLVTVSSTKDL